MNTLTEERLNMLEEAHKQAKAGPWPLTRNGFYASIIHTEFPSLISAARENLRLREALQTVRGLCMISGPRSTISFGDVYKVVSGALDGPKSIRPLRET